MQCTQGLLESERTVAAARENLRWVEAERAGLDTKYLASNNGAEMKSDEAASSGSTAATAAYSFTTGTGGVFVHGELVDVLITGNLSVYDTTIGTACSLTVCLVCIHKSGGM